MSPPISLVFSPIIDRINDITASLIQEEEEFLSLCGFKSDVEKLSRQFITSTAGTLHLDGSQLDDEPVRNWVGLLREAAYDAEDVLDTIATEASLWKINTQQVEKFLTRSVTQQQIKDISDRLIIIAQTKPRFLVGSNVKGGASHDRFLSILPTETVVDTRVFGREVEKEILIDLLLSDVSHRYCNVSLVMVTGEEGVGKTTVARLVYNDERIEKRFQLCRIWVTVAEEINLTTIIRGIMESYSKTKLPAGLSASETEIRFRNFLSGKPFLIVLDDLFHDQLWNDWNLVLKLMEYLDKGSRVLITSRTEHDFVSRAATTIKLECLSVNESWSMFQKFTFESHNVSGRLREDLEEIGRGIVAKCKGLPLAVKVMGSLLRGNTDLDSWIRILNSDKWEQDVAYVKALPWRYNYLSSPLYKALHLSYYHLPSDLKECFSFCSLFPKNYIFDKKELVKVWMAQGFIKSRGQEDIEEIGAVYFDELLKRSFFEPFEIDKYRMHAFMNDLAESISGSDYYKINRYNSFSFHDDCRHLSVPGNLFWRVNLKHSNKLRTILLVQSEKLVYCHSYDLASLFRTLKFIRILDLSSSMLYDLPSSIKECKLLRYLDLSNNPIRYLNSSICDLYNLQTLKLLGCFQFSILPVNLSKLVNLRHLDLDDVHWFNCSTLPPEIGSLTKLQNLFAFHVRLEHGYTITELKDMAYLSGTLQILGLENTVKAREANLKEKHKLQKLVFEWSSDNDNNEEAAERVLEELQPHYNIEELKICNYKGDSFPFWMKGLLQNLAVLTLKHCINCKILDLGKLRSLKELSIQGFLKLGWLNLQCPVLHRLEISDCPLIHSFPEDKLPASLLLIRIQNCPRLSERCQRGTGPEWPKIMHIPYLEIVDDLHVIEVQGERDAIEPVKHQPEETTAKEMKHHHQGEGMPGVFQGLESKTKSNPQDQKNLMSEQEQFIIQDWRKATSSQETELEIMQIQEIHAESHRSVPKQFPIPSETSIEETVHVEIVTLSMNNKGLTELPKDVEWEKCSLINLMDNELSELPESLKCPKLLALLLEGNLKLRAISHSFFDDMLALQVLNLSRTRIKFLPYSLFRLVKLKRLFLNHCELLLRLQSEVGELKCLEVLHLEGTTIMALPKEVERLTNLTSLKVSFCEPMSSRRSEQAEVLISDGVILALSQLEELNIDVSPEDVRWNASVENVVCEVRRLTELRALNFYFPRVELLKRNNMPIVSPSLSRFTFVVGDHTKRIISRLPHDVELMLEEYEKCLKYVNGEGAPEEIKTVLKHASAFLLDRHKTIGTLSEFGIINMKQLKCCIVGECDELQAIIDEDQTATKVFGERKVGLASLEYLYIYYVKCLSRISKGPVDDCSFTALKYLTFQMCPELTIIFTPELLANLSHLEELTVDDCPRITKLVSCNDSEDTTEHVLPSLKKISLHFLPELATISDILLISSNMEWMSFYYCPNLKRLPISKPFHENLWKIEGEQSWWQELKWESNEQDSWDDIFTAVDECECITTYTGGISAKS